MEKNFKLYEACLEPSTWQLLHAMAKGMTIHNIYEDYVKVHSRTWATM